MAMLLRNRFARRETWPTGVPVAGSLVLVCWPSFLPVHHDLSIDSAGTRGALAGASG